MYSKLVILLLAVLLAVATFADARSLKQHGCFMACTDDKKCNKKKGKAKKTCRYSCTCACYSSSSLMTDKEKAKCKKQLGRR